MKEQAVGKATWSKGTWESESKMLNGFLMEGLEGCPEAGPGLCVTLVKS